MKVTANLKRLIVNQERNLVNLDESRVKELVNKCKQEKGKRLTQEFELIKTMVDSDMKRNVDLAR